MVFELCTRLAVLAILTLCDIDACGAYDNQSVAPVGKTISSVVIENNDPIQANNQIAGSCSSSNETPHTTWRVNYNDGSAGDVAFVWPKYVQNGGKATIYYYFDPSMPTNVMQAGLNALTQWNTALSNNKSTGGYVQINLAQGDSYSAVTIYGSNDQPYNMSIAPNEGGDTLIGDIPSPYEYIKSVQLLIKNTQADLFGSYLHEIGHSLGLNHNQYQGSVMWPTVSNCSDGGPYKNDTIYLEETYDPELVLSTTTYSFVGCPYGGFSYDPGQQDYWGNDVPDYTLEKFAVKRPVGPCTAAQPTRPANIVTRTSSASYKAPDLTPSIEMNRSIGSKASIAFAERKLSKSATPLSGRFNVYPELRLSASYHPDLLFSLDDHSGAATMSLSSLYLASTLVAKVHVGGVVKYVVNGPIRYAIRSAVITSLIRHELGTDENRKVGQSILISDEEGAKGQPFLDDLPLREASDAVVFLQMSSRKLATASEQPIYRFTEPHISKLAVDASNIVEPYSNYDASIAGDLIGTGGAEVTNLLRLDPVREASTETALLTRLLNSRGISSQTAVNAYTQSMKHESWNAVRWAKSSQTKSR